jgi:type I restriction enzyme, S subunit
MSNKRNTTASKQVARPALVPKLRFPEFRNQAAWRVKSFSDLFTIGNGRDYKHLGAGEVPVYGSGGYMRSVNDYLYEGESVCIGRKGTINNPMFLSGRFWTVDTLFYSHSFLECHPKFIFAVFQQVDWLKHNEAGGVPSLSKTNIEKIKTAVPSVAEQQKIAECLSSLDELIAVQARKVDALKTHKKGLMQQLFPREGETQPRLRFPEFENAGKWEEKKLGAICDIQRGRFSHRPRNDLRFFGGPYPFIQTGDVVKSAGGAITASQSLNEEGLAVSKLFKPTIVLITIAANIGDTGLLQTEGCFTDSVAGLIPKRYVIPVFLELIMRGQKEYLNKVAGPGAQKNINNEILREVSVLLPPVPEQQRIASCLSSLDALITVATHQLEVIKCHKRGLMQLLFPSLEEVVV